MKTLTLLGLMGALGFTAAGCASVPHVSASGLANFQPEEPGVAGELVMHYQVVASEPVTKPCVMTLENVDENKRYALELPIAERDQAAVFELPPGKYVFRKMDCGSAFDVSDLQPHYPYVVHTIEHKISYLGKLEFRLLKKRSDYVVKSATPADTSILLKQDFGSLPEETRSRVISAYTTAKILPSAYLEALRNASKNLACSPQAEKKFTDALAPTFNTCLEDELDRNPLIVGSLRYRQAPSTPTGLKIVEDTSTYTDAFRECVEGGATKAQNKFEHAHRCEISF